MGGPGKGKGRGKSLHGKDSESRREGKAHHSSAGKGSQREQPTDRTGGPPAPDDGPEDSGQAKATRALIQALRAFSSAKWWHIGSNGGAQEVPATKRRAKAVDFQRHCAEKHAEMKKIYESAMMRDSEQRWLRKVSSEGTAGDRVASLTMLIQVCPVFSTGHIKALLGMAGRMGRSDSMMAVDGLKELFINTLLPDRKLKTLAQMEPISPKGLSKTTYTELCVVAFFEDFLKTAFAAFVQILSEGAHSTVLFFKTRAVRTTAELLAKKPEQERALLGLMVNKFGDLAPKVSSSVSFCLKTLLDEHPGMKRVIASEIESFLARPNIAEKSEYFAVLFLSEMKFSRSDADLAAQLIRLFVARLEATLNKPAEYKKEAWKPKKKWWVPKKKKKGIAEADNRLVRTLVNGIQRFFPYLDTASGNTVLCEDTMNALFKVCHTVSAFSTRIAILCLLQRCGSSTGLSLDRFYRLLYEQVAQFDLFACAHRLQGVLLLQKCVPADPCLGRGIALGRRLLQVGAGCAEPGLAAASLTLLRGLLLAHRAEVKPLLQSIEAELHPPETDDDAEEHFVDDMQTASSAADSRVERAAAKRGGRYRPLARDPKYARALYTPLWELYALSCHVHPFVAHGASKLISASAYEDVGSNPFEEFSCAELIERFVYASKRKGRSERARGQRGLEEKEAKQPINSEAFAKKKSVVPHERFFQLYFRDSTVQDRQRHKASQRYQQEDAVDEEHVDADEGDDDEGEEDRFFDRYMKDQLPKGDSDDEEDDVDSVESSAGDFEGEDEDDGFDSADMHREGDEGADGCSSSDAEGAASREKRTAEEADLPQRERGKRLKKKKHTGILFASAEDFDHLLED